MVLMVSRKEMEWIYTMWAYLIIMLERKLKLFNSKKKEIVIRYGILQM